jgi:murein tripeptide amidase MpaA
MAGAHARELVNPDAVLATGVKLCEAYGTSTGLTFGGKAFDAADIQSIVDQSDIILFPLVNPDGRAHVQAPNGQPMWRKNRNPNTGLPGKGVDLNRNYDFLWSSGIGTSASSPSDTYKGAAAFSEPEVRNVRYLLDAFPNIGMMLDVHSYAELVLYPWGDDNNQTTTQSMNFRNPAFDGLRGVLGDSLYQEFIVSEEAAWHAQNADRIRDAIAAVRGRVYTAEQSVGLYPTSGTADDYAFMRHLVDPNRRRVRAFTIETGTEFQPPFPEAESVMAEASAAILEACLINVASHSVLLPASA